ncbi:hypothetical protein CPB86DRAFT_420808 [Serendipita vermifera]|nr:hypothetical protein CPB86DRAFT_420808 [Serendipita vermifera]
MAFLSLLSLVVCGLWSLALSGSVNGQLVNGQYFTRGLAISNAPAPDSEFTVGGTIAVSVDVSGNGKMPQDSYGPNSTSPTGFISLSIYLVSDNKNVTVVDGSTGSFLAGEVGSTVKHLNFVVPNCLSEGRYEYTYYEHSRLNGTEYYAITPIPINVRNPGSTSGSDCDASINNVVQSRPQNDSAAPLNPWTNSLPVITSAAALTVPVTATITGALTMCVLALFTTTLAL